MPTKPKTILITALSGMTGNLGTGTIGRANLDGTGVDPTFVTATKPREVAVDDTHLYWASGATSSIGRVDLDGTDADPGFIPAVGDAWGLAADPLPLASPQQPPELQPAAVPSTTHDLRLGKVKRNKRTGTAKLTVLVSAPGDLALSKTKKIKSRAAVAGGAGEVKLAIKPRRRAKERLQRTGRAKVRAAITYTPIGSDPISERKAVKLLRRRAAP